MAKPLVGVVRAGTSNLGSVVAALRAVGADVSVIERSLPNGLRAIVLPGVGRFDTAMDALRKADLTTALADAAANPAMAVLGICLGMQLLASFGEEGGVCGLDIVPGIVRRFPPATKDGIALRVPHMGWAAVVPADQDCELGSQTERDRFYFVHSYFVEPSDARHVAARAKHGIEFAAAIRMGRVVGVQFHPEKSHRFGLAFLRRWLTEVVA